MRPLALSDRQLSILRDAAETLHPAQRGAFLESVVELLRGCEIGDGAIAEAASEALRRYRQRPPLTSSASAHSS